FDFVAPGTLARRDNGTDSAPRLQHDHGIRLLRQIADQRRAGRGTNLLIAITDKGYTLIIRLLVLDQRMQPIEADEQSRFHIQNARALSDAQPVLLADRKGAALCVA